MTNEARKDMSQKYCRHFGRVAVESEFVDEVPLAQTPACRGRRELDVPVHRVQDEILFENEQISAL